jgi:NAD-dependent deacetylase
MILLPICARDFKNVVVLTGAGVSAGSGLQTFRGPGGLWNEEETQKLSTVDSMLEFPDRFWKFWGGFRAKILQSEPNGAHIALAEWESQFTDNQSFTLITQNIDELHQRAGSKNVVEMHGTLFKTRCSNKRCHLPAFRDSEAYEDGAPRCKLCGHALRPDLVFFGEMLPLEAERAIKVALRDCRLFLAVGTSGTVSPAASFVQWARYAGAQTVLVNLEKMESGNHAFERCYLGKAEEILPLLLT